MNKIVYCPQMNNNECGLCCISMIGSYYGFFEPIHFYRSMIDIGRDGLSISQIKKIFNQLGIESNIGKVEEKKKVEIKKNNTPLILYRNNHFVVAEYLEKRAKFKIYDPALGIFEENLDFLIKNYDYYIYTEITDKFEKKDKSRSIFGRYKFLIDGNRKYLFRILMVSFFIYLINILIPISIQKIIDSINYEWIENGVIYVLLLFTGTITIIYFLLSLLRNRFLIRVQYDLDLLMNSNLVSHLLGLNYRYFENRSSSDIFMKLSLTGSLRDIISNSLIDGLIDSGVVIFLLVYFCILSPISTIALIIIIIFIFIFLTVMNNKIEELSKISLNSNIELNSIELDFLNTIFLIKAMSLETNIYDQFSISIKKFLNEKMKVNKLILFNSTVLNIINTFVPFVLFLFSFSGIIYQTTIGKSVAIFSVSGMILSSSISLFQTYSSFGVIKVSLERIADIFDENSKNILSIKENNIKDNFNEIIFDNVSFKYSSNSKAVLQNINLNILSGDTISFVGATGCGKSTLVKLLVGLYDPTEGNILVDSCQIENIKHLISIVPQENMLSNKTIKENLLLGTNGIDDHSIISACKKAEIYEDIMKMPMQFNSIISEVGDNISGGQKQRISIARALLHNPKILILDEATSSLDNITESKIEKNLQAMNCTIIKIAHRLETVISSNCIYYLESGKIVEKGSHNELIAKKGKYYNLYNNNKVRGSK